MGGGDHSLKSSAPQLLWFGTEGVMKIFSQRMTYRTNETINESINDEGVCRTATATPGLLNKAQTLS